MTLWQLRRKAAERLKSISGDSAGFEADQIIRFVFPGDALKRAEHTDADEEAAARVDEIVSRREAGEPLQYIFGEWEFMGLPFTVRPGVLIPRADTEILCEKALSLIRSGPYRTVLDLCCGSGCIGVSLRKYSDAEVTCADIDENCLALAKENAGRNGVDVALLQGDLFDAVAGRRFDLICCNPPYLSEADMDSLQTEVRHEPALALYGGRDGLDYYRRIAKDYERFLSPGGTMLLEIGSAQEAPVRRLFPKAEVIHDYAGLPRVITIGGSK
ncbi:MAG: peptide chain release factor N(5)-glutamine methyltransferase [Clostridia bacterium]|nr:peptide chain release factor N(5)-glutamine methyltransferase [Clostridia bacterium]